MGGDTFLFHWSMIYYFQSGGFKVGSGCTSSAKCNATGSQEISSVKVVGHKENDSHEVNMEPTLSTGRKRYLLYAVAMSCYKLWYFECRAQSDRYF